MTPDVRVMAGFGRESVLVLRANTRRRKFPATLSVHPLTAGIGDATRAGGPAYSDTTIGPPAATWGAPAAGTSNWDWHLRRELVSRLVEQVPQEAIITGAEAAGVLLVWTRPGPAEREDDDAAWWAAARSACTDVLVRPHGLAVVTRWGWWMVPEGPGRRWQRLRRRQTSQERPVTPALVADGQSSGQV